MIAASPTLDEVLLQRICAEYHEMPALRLTLPQAQRLWSLDRDTCAEALGELVRTHCLWRSRDGIYAKAGVGEDVCAWHRTGGRA